MKIKVSGCARPLDTAEIEKIEKGLSFKDDVQKSHKDHPGYREGETLIPFIARMYHGANMPSAEIGEIFGRTRQWVLEVLKKAGIPRKSKGGMRFKGHITERDIKIIRDPELSIFELAEKYICAENTIKNIKNEVTYREVR